MEFCTRHMKRWEKGASVCLGCHEDAVRAASNAVRQDVSNTDVRNAPVREKSNGAFDKTAYQREYMRRLRAQKKSEAV